MERIQTPVRRALGSGTESRSLGHRNAQATRKGLGMGLESVRERKGLKSLLLRWGGFQPTSQEKMEGALALGLGLGGLLLFVALEVFFQGPRDNFSSCSTDNHSLVFDLFDQHFVQANRNLFSRYSWHDSNYALYPKIFQYLLLQSVCNRYKLHTNSTTFAFVANAVASNSMAGLTARRCDMTYDAIASRVYHLHGLVEEKADPKSDLAQAFSKLNQDDPPKGDVIGAFIAWAKIERAERQRMLNGWRDVCSFPSEQEITARPLECCESVQRFLQIHASRETMDVIQTFGFDGASTSKVRLDILEGSTREQVLQALREMTDLVATRWEEFIGLRPDSIHGVLLIKRDKEDGLKDSINAHQLGGKESEELESQEAAVC
jgi:hypothetical protein